MSWVVGILLLVGGLWLSAFFSGSETGLYCVNRLRIRLAARSGDRRAVRLEKFLEDRPGALSVTLIGTNLMNYITTVAAAYILADLVGLSENKTEILTIALLTPIVFVFAEVTPKNLFQRNADRLMLKGSRLLSISGLTLRAIGAVWTLKNMAAVITRLVGADDALATGFDAKRRVAFLLREALVGEVAGEEQSELVDRILTLSETRLHRVMVPRNRVTTIAANADVGELRRLSRRTAHSIVPVFERNPRRIIGAVKIDNLLCSHRWTVVSDEVRSVTKFKAHETVATAIDGLQRSRHPLGIVVDRGGLMLGIVTMKDLLEEIVGELEAW